MRLSFACFFRLCAKSLVEQKVADNGRGSLLPFIRDKIRATGSMSLAEYMQLCATAPHRGYYTGERAVFGADGDFVTAPELSQMFGELLAVWLVHESRHRCGRRAQQPWQLVELGPGSGTLARDLLRVCERLRVAESLSLHLVEVSEPLALRQCSALCGAAPPRHPADDSDSPWYLESRTERGTRVRWYKDVGEVPRAFSVFVAQEFFDALPIHQFRRDSAGEWREVCVDLRDVDDAAGGLRFALAPSATLPLRAFLPERVSDDAARDVWEVSPISGSVLTQLAMRIVEDGGIGVVVDYGHCGERRTASLRAYSRHEHADPLVEPGGVDLTADVDFDYLTSVVRDEVCVFGPVAQGRFLQRLGIDVRFNQLLSKSSDDAQKKYLRESRDYLVESAHMGDKFKVISLFPKVLAPVFACLGPPTGFESS